jgi:hypothetical protein
MAVFCSMSQAGNACHFSLQGLFPSRLVSQTLPIESISVVVLCSCEASIWKEKCQRRRSRWGLKDVTWRRNLWFVLSSLAITMTVKSFLSPCYACCRLRGRRFRLLVPCSTSCLRSAVYSPLSAHQWVHSPSDQRNEKGAAVLQCTYFHVCYLQNFNLN